jgi:hypothetical protein
LDKIKTPLGKGVFLSLEEDFNMANSTKPENRYIGVVLLDEK